MRSLSAAIVLLGLTACAPDPPPPPRVPPRPKAPPAAPPPTLEQKVRDLEERERSSPTAYRALHQAWSALIPEAKGGPYESVLRDRLERLEGSANRAYRDRFRPLQAEVRDLVAQRRAGEALERLRLWRIPEDLDIGGRLEEDRRKELARLDRLVKLDAARLQVGASYHAGFVDREPADALQEFLRSPDVSVQAEAERALLDLRRLRGMERARQRLAKAAVRPSPSVFGDLPGSAIPAERKLSKSQPEGYATLLVKLRALVRVLGAAGSLAEFEPTLAETIRLLDDSIRTHGYYPLTWYYRAEWKLGLLGDPLGAVEDLDEAIRRQGNFVEARLARALVLLRLTMGNEAATELRVLSRTLGAPLKGPIARVLDLVTAGGPARAAEALADALRALPERLEFTPAAPRKRAPRPEWTPAATFETDHYVLHAEKDGGAGLAEWVEAARTWFPEIVAGTPRAGKASIYLFAGEESYAAYADTEEADVLSPTAGKYLPSERQVALYMRPNLDELRDTLAHEAFHEYLHSLGFRAPVWLSEGLADYAAGVRVRDGRVVERGVLPRADLLFLQSAIGEGFRGIPLESLMGESREEFYGVLRSLQYAQAWSLVHFFRHAHKGRRAAAFDRYLSLVFAGRAEAFAAAFPGDDPASLHREWLDYVRTLK